MEYQGLHKKKAHQQAKIAAEAHAQTKFEQEQTEQLRKH